MRISDWSSDVCSSDLGRHRRQQYQPPLRPTNEQGRQHHANEQITQERHLDVGFVRRGQATKVIESFLEGNRDGSLEKLRLSRSEEHTSELQSLMRISYAVFYLKILTDRLHIQDHNALFNACQQPNKPSYYRHRKHNCL